MAVKLTVAQIRRFKDREKAGTLTMPERKLLDAVDAVDMAIYEELEELRKEAEDRDLRHADAWRQIHHTGFSIVPAELV